MLAASYLVGIGKSNWMKAILPNLSHLAVVLAFKRKLVQQPNTPAFLGVVSNKLEQFLGSIALYIAQYVRQQLVFIFQVGQQVNVAGHDAKLIEPQPFVANAIAQAF